MRNISVRLLALVLLLSLSLFCGCSENGSSNEETFSQEASEKNVTLATCSEEKMNIYRAIFQETGFDPVIEASYDSEQQIYTDVKLNAYYAAGTKYYHVTEEEYKSIQDYQNRTGIQVLYPVVKPSNRPKSPEHKNNANIFFQIEELQSNSIVPVLDQNGDFVPNYWAYAVDSEKPAAIQEYNSIRIEGESGVDIDGEKFYYAYGNFKGTEGVVEVRVFLYTYYEYLKQINSNIISPEDQFFGLK